MVIAGDIRHARELAEPPHRLILARKIELIKAVELNTDVGHIPVNVFDELQHVLTDGHRPDVFLCHGIIETAAVDTAKGGIDADLLGHIADEIGHSSGYKGEISALRLEVLDRGDVFLRDSLIGAEQSTVEIGTDQYSVEFSHFASPLR